MKIYIISFILFLSAFLPAHSQSTSSVTLEFRVNSPRIIYGWNNTMNGGVGGNCQNLDLDVEVKGNADSYCHALEIHMTTNNSALTDLDFTLASGWTQWYSLITYNLFNNNINLSIANSKPQNSGNATWWSQIPTTWKVIGSLRLRITDANAMQNCTWLTALMTGLQYEKYFGTTPGIQQYLGFNCDGTPISNLYLGRIYSSTWLWSQVGGSTAGNQYIDWTSAVNTSVWDTTASAATITFSGSLANALRIHNGARLAINAGASLTCSGNTEINSPKGLWIVSGASSTGSFIDNGITYNTGGTALVEQYLVSGKWHGYCIPLQSTSVIPFRGVYMKYWTESNHNFHYIVVPAPLDSTLLGNPFRGYLAWTTVSSGITKVSPDGYLNTGSFSSIPATRTEATQQTPGNGYNLLGNPYPSALDLSSSGINWNQLDQKAWVWNPGLGNYTVYVKGGSGNTHSQYIPPQQGFFVHHVEPGTNPTTLDVTNAARTHTLIENFLKDSPPDVISLKANSVSNGKGDLTTVYFSSEATLNYDETMDADKITGDNDAPQLYSIMTDRNLTINAIPWTGISQIVPLGFFCGVSGNYTITASNLQSFRQGTEIFMKDLKLNQTQSLIQDSVYSFSYQTGESSGRFQLLFSNPYYGAPTRNPGSINVYAFEEHVYVSFTGKTDIHGTLTIFDQVGRRVFTGNLENKQLNQFRPGLLQGYYIVMVKTDESLINRKIYLK